MKTTLLLLLAASSTFASNGSWRTLPSSSPRLLYIPVDEAHQYLESRLKLLEEERPTGNGGKGLMVGGSGALLFGGFMFGLGFWMTQPSYCQVV